MTSEEFSEAPPFKIGDHIYSDSHVFVPTDSFDRCKYCNNLSLPSERQSKYFRGSKLAKADFISGNRVEPCVWCNALAKCIKAFEPQAEEMAKVSPTTAMYLVINEQNIMTLRTPLSGGFVIQERWNFQLYRSPGTELLPEGLVLPTCPELASVPGDEPMWDYLRQCLMTCLYSHDECRAAQEIGWLPRRLIWVENTGGPLTSVRLIETTTTSNSSPYIALSHCWGQLRPLRLLKSNTVELHQHLAYDSLSRVFQDTLTTAQRFGINYVWIDSLCIVQDDEIELNSQIAQMNRIYENAIFVVAATASSNGDIPFLGPDAPSTRKRVSRTIDLTAELGSPFAVRARTVGNDSNLTAHAGPLKHRAWAWQEDILSTRIMHFTEEQVIWRCASTIGSEIMGNMDAIVHPRRRVMLDPAKRLYEWQHLVEAYAGLALTDSRDRLPALAGVAQRFQTALDDEYVAGLWRRPLLVDLCWETAQVLNILTRPTTASMQNGNPSWSWASIRDHIKFQLMAKPAYVDVLYDVANIDCEPFADNNPLGRVHEGASLQLVGRMVPAVLLLDEWGLAVVHRSGQAPQRVLPDCRLVPTRLLGDAEDDLPSLRRAMPDDPPVLPDIDNSTDAFEEKAEAKNRLIAGRVLVLLCLCRTSLDEEMKETDEQHAYVMVLAQVGKEPELYQRIGIGRGGKDLADDEGKEVITWRWTSYELWEKWEDFFEGGEIRGVTVI